MRIICLTVWVFINNGFSNFIRKKRIKYVLFFDLRPWTKLILSTCTPIFTRFLCLNICCIDSIFCKHHIFMNYFLLWLILAMAHVFFTNWPFFYCWSWWSCLYPVSLWILLYLRLRNLCPDLFILFTVGHIELPLFSDTYPLNVQRFLILNFNKLMEWKLLCWLKCLDIFFLLFS